MYSVDGVLSLYRFEGPRNHRRKVAPAEGDRESGVYNGELTIEVTKNRND